VQVRLGDGVRGFVCRFSVVLCFVKTCDGQVNFDFCQSSIISALKLS